MNSDPQFLLPKKENVESKPKKKSVADKQKKNQTKDLSQNETVDKTIKSYVCKKLKNEIDVTVNQISKLEIKIENNNIILEIRKTKKRN